MEDQRRISLVTGSWRCSMGGRAGNQRRMPRSGASRRPGAVLPLCAHLPAASPQAYGTPTHKLFERSCDLGLWRLTADKIAEIFGTRLNRTMRGKLATVINRIEHGHHVFRAYFKHAFLKQYEKFATFLRNELASNDLADFRLEKGLDHLDAVRERFQTITGRFAGFQAQSLNVHVDFPLLHRLGLPITIGAREEQCACWRGPSLLRTVRASQ
jgi:hypothetical protein